jgi:hypothetical protein
METSVPDLPQQLFHYTSPTALLSVLQKKVVWASMIHYMNDSQELDYALDLAREVISEEAMHRSFNVSRFGLCGDFLEAIRRIAVFAFSLSERQDLLSQWRAYCPPEGGYSIAFDTLHLKSIAEAEGFQLVQCDYDRAVQISKIRPLINEMLQAASRLPDGSTGTDLYDRFAVRMARIGVSVKHPSFQEEREWRLITGPGRNPNSVSYRATTSLLVPYCELSFAEEKLSPITSIMVGPNRHADLAARSVHSLTATTHGWPIQVLHSETPFRVLR